MELSGNCQEIAATPAGSYIRKSDTPGIASLNPGLRAVFPSGTNLPDAAFPEIEPRETNFGALRAVFHSGTNLPNAAFPEIEPGDTNFDALRAVFHSGTNLPDAAFPEIEPRDTDFGALVTGNNSAKRSFPKGTQRLASG